MTELDETYVSALEDQISDLTRTLTKVEQVLIWVDKMLKSEARMNAAKHLSEEAFPNPLAAKVNATLSDIDLALRRSYKV